MTDTKQSLLDNSAVAQQEFVEALAIATEKYVSVMTEHTPHTSEEAENMKDSGRRMAKALGDMIHCKSLMVDNLKEILSVSFPVTEAPAYKHYSAQSSQILRQGKIDAVSLCPHHFLPVRYSVFIAIKIPTGSTADAYSLFGLSKYVRAVQELSKRPVLQEQYTRDIVELLVGGTFAGSVALGTSTVAGCMVIVKGYHGCMSCRGVKSSAFTETEYSINFSDLEIQNTWSSYNNDR